MGLPSDISRSIDQAIEHLRRIRTQPPQDSTAGETDGLLFLGQWHDAYPTVLVRDPFLSDSAKIQWLYLAQEARQQPHRAIAMPTIQETSRALHQARGSVIRDRLLLRICRWISAVRPVRDPETGRFLGQIYAMHGEPVQWHAAIEYDANYVELIERSTTHQDRRVQRAALASLAGLHERIRAGTDPLAPVDPVALRISTARAIESGWGIAWGLPIGFEPPGPEFGLGEDLLAESAIESETGTVPGPNPGPGQLPGRRPDPVPGTDSGPGDPMTAPTPGPNPGPGGVRSSSKNTNTTTTTADTEPAHDPRGTLTWPSAFDDNMRRLLHQTLRVSTAATHHQDIVDALAHKARDRDDPLRNPVAYAIELCNRVRNGTFQRVGPPFEPAAGKNAAGNKDAQAPAGPNITLLRSQLLGEIAGLRRLRRASGGDAAGAMIERQIADLELRLANTRGEGR
jgi:hypothetical protein